MQESDRSKKIMDVLRDGSQKTCPVCGEGVAEKRIIGGVKNGKDEPFDERIICPVCGTDLTAENDQSVAPLKRSERDAIRQMRVQGG